jgi:Leucine-rich repeat (LRR) protein
MHFVSNLSYNSIEGEVKKELFLNLTNLKYLRLNNNKITSIELNAFSNLNKLIELDLSYM